MGIEDSELGYIGDTCELVGGRGISPMGGAPPKPPPEGSPDGGTEDVVEWGGVLSSDSES